MIIPHKVTLELSSKYKKLWVMAVLRSYLYNLFHICWNFETSHPHFLIISWLHFSLNTFPGVGSRLLLSIKAHVDVARLLANLVQRRWWWWWWWWWWRGGGGGGRRHNTLAKNQQRHCLLVDTCTQGNDALRQVFMKWVSARSWGECCRFDLACADNY